MPISARLLRAIADDLPGARPKLSPRELAQQDRILATATSLIARFGRAGLTMAAFATALRMSPATIRRHFPDLDSILAEILLRHLHAIAGALGEVPYGAPNRPAARRAAYVKYTRTPYNAPTEAHLILLRERHALPPDLAEPVEKLRTLLGDMLAPATPEVALTLLDLPELQTAQIETLLAALAPAAQPAPAPDAPQTAARPSAPEIPPAAPRPTAPPLPDSWHLTQAKTARHMALAP